VCYHPPTGLPSCDNFGVATVQPQEAGLIFDMPNTRKVQDLSQVSLSLAGQFYQRALPASQVSFASAAGRQLFREALAEGHMENYFFLAEQFRTQDEPTFCGLTTLAMVLNSLRIDPMRTWKGAWRWISEEMLCCCTTADKVRKEGLSFDMFKNLALCQGARVETNWAPSTHSPVRLSHQVSEVADFTETFRDAVRRIGSSSARECLVICYSRERLGQTGAGHFSPIGGFHEASDSVLIMDVARFKYPPHWAPVQDVVEAMMHVDPDTGRPRGFLQLRLKEYQPESLFPRPLYVPDVPAAAGRRLAEILSDALASQCAALADEPFETTTVRRWLHAASIAEPQVVKRLLMVGDSNALREVLARLSTWPLYKELCTAYAMLVSSEGGFKGIFPPIGFEMSNSDEMGLGLDTHGELWVLLLLLLPQRLRAAVSEELGSALIPHALLTTVRGPWALPLEALREILAATLAPEQCQGNCAFAPLPAEAATVCTGHGPGHGRRVGAKKRRVGARKRHTILNAM